MTDHDRPTTEPTGAPAPAASDTETTAVPVPTSTIQPPTAPKPGAGRMRTLVAAGLIALVVASTAVATLVLTSSQTTSTVLGYVPADSVAYGELRLDLPGDQRQNVAEFLSKFPGFADQAALDTKLDEVLDRLVSEGDRRQADVHEGRQAVVRRRAGLRDRRRSRAVPQRTPRRSRRTPTP